MKKMAVIVASDAFDRKGMFNAVAGRVKAMQAKGNYIVDFWCLQCRDSELSRKKRHTVKPPYECRETEVSHLNADGLEVNLLWYDFSLADALLFDRLHWFRPCWNRFAKHCAHLFKSYDFISAHSFEAASLALRTGTPFCITWHGSDIHTAPFRNPAILKETRNLMAQARCNIFVSEDLLEKSNRILVGCKKMASSNGIDSSFYTFPQKKKLEARHTLGIGDKDIAIGYAGNFLAVKNVTALPAIFSNIAASVDNCRFFCAGDGKLRQKVADAMTVPCTFVGNIPPERMPEFFNALDILVLPSLNEGFPLVCAEALACGCRVIGSNVGAIPEIIGEDNTADPHDGMFCEKLAGIAKKAASKLSETLPVPDYRWENVVSKEEKYSRQ